jgi:hypothetical protein
LQNMPMTRRLFSLCSPFRRTDKLGLIPKIRTIQTDSSFLSRITIFEEKKRSLLGSDCSNRTNRTGTSQAKTVFAKVPGLDCAIYLQVRLTHKGSDRFRRSVESSFSNWVNAEPVVEVASPSCWTFRDPVSGKSPLNSAKQLNSFL